MTLPFINLKTIQKTTDLPGYIHRLAYTVAENGMLSSYEAFSSLSIMEFQHLLLISKSLFQASQNDAESNFSISFMMKAYTTFAEVLSCGEGDVFTNNDKAVLRTYNLTRMVGYWLLQSQNLGKIIPGKFSVNADMQDKMFLTYGEGDSSANPKPDPAPKPTIEASK